jgi:hypothetical protein
MKFFGTSSWALFFYQLGSNAIRHKLKCGLTKKTQNEVVVFAG